MKRRLFRFMLALSCALILSVGALSIRSRTYHDAVNFVDWGGASWSIGSRFEGMRVWRISPWPVAERPAWRSYRRGSDPLLLQLHAVSRNRWHWFGLSCDSGIATVPLSNATGMPLWAHDDDEIDWATCHPSPVVNYYCITLRHWEVMVALGFLPMMALIGRIDPRRRGRRLVILALAATSLALCIGICALWIRSYRMDDRFRFVHEGLPWSGLVSRGNVSVDNAEARAVEKSTNNLRFEYLKEWFGRDDERAAEISSLLDGNLTPEKRLDLQQEDRQLDAHMKALMKKMSAIDRAPAADSHSIPLVIPAGISLLLPLFIFGPVYARRRRMAQSLSPACA